MNTYVIRYNDIDNENKVMYEYENIVGKNPKDALQKRFTTPLRRLTGDNGRYANVIISKGSYNKETNSIHYDGNGAMLCYGII